MKNLRENLRRAFPAAYLFVSVVWVIVYSARLEWWPKNHFFGNLFGNFWILTVGLMVIGLLFGCFRWKLGDVRPSRLLDIGFLMALILLPANLILVFLIGASGGFAPPILIPLILGFAIVVGWFLGLRSYRTDLKNWQSAANGTGDEGQTNVAFSIAYRAFQFVVGNILAVPLMAFIMWVASWYRGPLGPVNMLGRPTFLQPQAAINHRAALILIALGLVISIGIGFRNRYRWLAIGFAVSTLLLGLLVYHLK